MPVTHEYIPYGGWKKCLRLKNGVVELIIPQEIGIRILNFAFSEGNNLFAEFHEQLGLSGGDMWRIYGGHRLWHAPETRDRTYSLDNDVIDIQHEETYTRLTQAVDHAGIIKQMDIHLSPDKAEVTIMHRLTNTTPWELSCAPWALSVMATHGKAIIPLPPRGNHETNLLPTTRLNLWAYSDMTDPRWVWGKEFIILKQDVTIVEPQKIGLTIPQGWAGYWKHGTLFIKKTAYDATAIYPDFNSNYEFFTNNTMLEVETLGPLALLQPGASVEHTETWYLYNDVEEPHTEADIQRIILPLIH